MFPRLRLLTCLVVAAPGLVACGPGFGNPLGAAPAREVTQALPVGDAVGPVHFRGITLDLPRGVDFGGYVIGLTCAPPYQRISWAAIREQFSGAARTATDGLEAGGVRTLAPSRALGAERDALLARPRLEGRVVHARMELCRRVNWLTGWSDGISGEAEVRVEWRLLNPADGRVLFQAETLGQAETDGAALGGDATVLHQALLRSAEAAARLQPLRREIAGAGRMAAAPALQAMPPPELDPDANPEAWAEDTAMLEEAPLEGAAISPTLLAELASAPVGAPVGASGATPGVALAPLVLHPPQIASSGPVPVLITLPGGVRTLGVVIDPAGWVLAPGAPVAPGTDGLARDGAGGEWPVVVDRAGAGALLLRLSGTDFPAAVPIATGGLVVSAPVMVLSPGARSGQWYRMTGIIAAQPARGIVLADVERPGHGGPALLLDGQARLIGLSIPTGGPEGGQADAGLTRLRTLGDVLSALSVVLAP